MCVWTSTPPGITYRSVASISTSAWTGIPTPIAATRSSSITTSAFVVSVAVTTVPPLMRVLMRSSSFPDVRAFRHHPTAVRDRQTEGRRGRAILHR